MENINVIDALMIISPGVESVSNNLGIEARIANAIELPQITLRETWKLFTFSIIFYLFFSSCFVKDRTFLKGIYLEIKDSDFLIAVK
jgi:ABC-type multidrug transport system permease subunit